MTISATTLRKSFTGDGSTTAFSFDKRFLADADLKVYQEGTLKTITTHYTVTGAGNSGGGTVTFLTAPAVDDEIVIINDPANTQSLDLVGNDPFPAESLEAVLDRLTLQIQRCRDLISRSVVLADSDIASVTTTLPTPTASYYLRWNSGGTALENVAALSGTIAVSSFSESLLDETSAANWRTGLGLGTLAIQNAASVAITGGTIGGVTQTSSTLGAGTTMTAGTISGVTMTSSTIGAGATITSAATLAHFTGSNQSLAASGYQKLAGGLILQWGTVAVGTDTTAAITFPMAFPTACVHISGSGDLNAISGSSAAQAAAAFTGVTTTGCTVSNDMTAQNVLWFAIGY